MIEKDIVQLLTTGNWSALWAYVRSKHDISILDAGVLCLLEGILWKNPEGVASIVKRAYPKATTALEAFLFEAARLAVGDSSNTHDSLHRLKRSNAPAWMTSWLEVERFGRQREYVKQAKLISKCATAQLRSILSVPALSSLSHSDVDSAPLLRHFAEFPPEGLSQEILYLAMKQIHSPPMAVLEYADKIAEEYGDHPSIDLRRSVVLLRELGRPKEALIALDKVAAQSLLDANELNVWLEISLCHRSGREYLPARVKHAIQNTPPQSRLQSALATYVIIWFWMEDRMGDAKQVLENHRTYATLPLSTLDKNTRIYFNYMRSLISHREEHGRLYQQECDGELHAIGESHSLTLANLTLPWFGRHVKAKTHLVMGLKMHHLASDSPSCLYRKEMVRANLQSVPPNTDLLICIGEIDCRPDEGILEAAKKSRKSLDAILEETVRGYMNFLAQEIKRDAHRTVTIQGIPLPGYGIEGANSARVKDDVAYVIAKVNTLLRDISGEKRWGFLDLSGIHEGKQIFEQSIWHLDTYHLKPSFYEEAERFVLAP